MDSLLIWVLGGLLAVAVVCLIALWVRVAAPVKKLKKLTAQLDALPPETLRQKAEDIGGAPGETARAVAAYVAAREGRAEHAGGPASTEEQYKLRVVEEICSSLQPQALKNSGQSQVFTLAGGMQQGAFRNCAFYDYFYLDDTTLCLTVGQVPGSGIAEALFAVVAQTAIRSRLHMGRSLTETMSDANAQLYDLGGRNTVNVVVCLFNTASGRLSFVNAGGDAPFVMRSEERYEQLKTPVYAPLGANESVKYRSEVLRLAQGDRLFFYSADLCEMTNREGEPFGRKELLAALNLSRTRADSPEAVLRFVHDEAAAFCESGDDVCRSAAIALEYLKGNRDFMFTLVHGTPEEAPVVTEFLRKVLEDGAVPAKDSARQILLGDELFALCCRACREGAIIRVECAITPEENAFHLRMLAPMGGSDPLKVSENGAGGEAAVYIRTHTKRAVFEPGIERDMLEIVSALA